MRQSSVLSRFLVRLVLVASLAFLHAPAFAQGVAQKAKGVERNNVKRRLGIATTDLERDLRDAKNLLRRVTNGKVRRQLEALIGRAEANLTVIKAELVLGQSRWTSLTESEFVELVNQVRGQSLSKKRSEYLGNYVNLSLNSESEIRLTSAQVKRLLAEIQLDKDRVPAATMLFRITSDKQNFLTALDAITFDRNRKLVRSRVGIGSK